MINFKYIYFLLFICISFNSFSQVINIEYTSNSLTGGACIGERHKITLSQNTYSRLDLFDYTTIEENVELTNTGYDDAGLYFEIWSPKIPDNLNRNNVNKYTKGRRIIKIYYLSRRTDVMNITEVLIDTKQKRYFFTELASDLLCEKYWRDF